MPKLKIKQGTTSKLVRVFIQDASATDGSGLTGLVYNSASLTAYYIPEGDASPTQITLASATVGTYTSGGFKEIDATNMPGLYEIGLPDAVVDATSEGSTLVMLKGATNMAPVLMEIELDAVDYRDSVRAGLTALPNAAAGSAGGLPTDSTGKTAFNDLDAAGVRSAVGLASANLDTTFGDIKGSTFDTSTDSLEAIRDRGDSDWVTGGSGSGLYTLTVTIEDSGGSVLQGAKVNVSGTTLTATTGANGQVTFNLDAGTYSLLVLPPAGYATPSNTSVMISANATQTIVLSDSTTTDTEGWI
jgi:hypothetical protein